MPEDAKEAFDFFTAAGWTKEQSAGLVANIEAESSFNFRAVGDGGSAFGLCQWHPDRQRNFRQRFNKNIRDSSFREQLQFVDFELQGTERHAGNSLRGARTAQEAGEIVSSQYERPDDPDGHVRRHRGERAEELLSSLAP
jgi:hypothetical protein